MKKNTILVMSGIVIMLLLGLATMSIGSNKYLPQEYEVQQQVISTFDLDVADSDVANSNEKTKSDKLKPLFTRDIYDNEIATESEELRGKIGLTISSLFHEKEITEGDFKPMIFLKGNHTVYIGVKHPDNTITLSKFDISKEKPVKIGKEVKELKE